MLLKFKSYRTTKNRLWKTVKPMGNKEFSQYINPIIAENRNLPLEDVKALSFLQSKEVLAFMDKLGGDIGQGKVVVFDTMRTTKKILRSRIPHLSNPEFIAKINAIIIEKRKGDPVRLKCKQYLSPRELLAFLNEIGEEPFEKTGGGQ